VHEVGGSDVCTCWLAKWFLVIFTCKWFSGFHMRDPTLHEGMVTRTTAEHANVDARDAMASTWASTDISCPRVCPRSEGQLHVRYDTYMSYKL